MSMTLSKTIDVGAGGFTFRVTVRELTVGEIRVLMKRLAEAGNPDPVGDTLLDEISLVDLQSMTDLESEQLDELTPNQLRQVFEACREVNKDFFALRERVEQIGRAVLAQLSNSSNETPAP
ncbi:hypothetical protein D9M68_303360 [compost metagenome]